MPESVEQTREGLLTIRTAENAGGLVVLEVEGELDLSTIPKLQGAFQGQNGATEALVDLSRVSFIDSSGIAALVAAFRARDGAMRVVIDPGSQVARVFEVARLGEVIPVFTDRAEALVGLGAHEAPA